jgi:hypothetical protein
VVLYGFETEPLTAIHAEATATRCRCS